MSEEILKQVHDRLSQARALLNRIDENIEVSNVAFSKTASAKKTAHTADSTKDDLVFIGMGDGAVHESSHLSTVTEEGVTAIRQRGGEYNTTITTPDGVFDVGSTKGIEDFIETIPTDPKKMATLVDILESTQVDARDEVAQIIQVFSQAESDDREMDRLVLSGHSGGDSIWGDTNGTLQFETLQRICDEFPEAAAQINDLMLSACNSGGEAGMETYRKMFPNIKSIWAYTDTSPGAYKGAVTHMKLWEKASEGDDTSKINPKTAAGQRKGSNVATWTEDDGYTGRKHQNIWEVIEEYEEQEETWKAYYSGKNEVSSTSSGPMRDYYNLIQAALFNPELPSDDKAKMKKRKNLVLRVLFYSVIRKKFAAHYDAQLIRGYEVLGTDCPPYATMSRGEMVQAVRKFKADGGDANVHEILYKGLVKLSPKWIPQNWI